MSRRTRRSPGAGPGIATQSAGWDTDKPQGTTSGGAAGSLQEQAAWARASRRRSIERDLVAASMAQSTGRAA